MKPEEALCKIYQCSPDELQLNITLNPSKELIEQAMNEWGRYVFEESRKDLKVKTASYTMRNKQKLENEDVISDEYWTTHKNLDGSVLHIRVKPILKHDSYESISKG